MFKDVVSKKVFKLFQQYKDRPFVFIESGGNFGDHLIYKGTLKLSKDLNINPKIVTHKEFMAMKYTPQTVIYIHGGGSYNDYWCGTPMDELVKASNEHSGVIIQGPTTWIDKPDYLKKRIVENLKGKSNSRIIIFVREEYSLKVAEKVLPDWMELDIDHDMAFNLTKNDFPQPNQNRRYNLFAIRTDKEQVEYDSKELFSVRFDPISYAKSFDEWVQVHCNAKKIVANRTHSAILGSILDIPTTILANSYHKNRAVWEYSLKAKGVHWADEVPVNKFSGLATKNIFVQKLLNSYNLNKLTRQYFNIRLYDNYKKKK